MIRTLLAHKGGLARGALAFLLSRESGIKVIAELDRGEEVEPAVHVHRPDVTVVDLDLTAADGMPVAWALHHRLPDVAMVIVADRRRSGVLGHALTADKHRTGFLANDRPPEHLVAAVKAVARGEPPRDPELARAANGPGSPLTAREQEVLWVAANGRPVREIAATLRLSVGTVHNHLSRIIGKTRSRSRIEAINVARRAGWI